VTGVPASWIRRDFSTVGVTQYRPGRQLAAVQAHLVGRALLCIDVSGSMSGEPLHAAVEGGLDFLSEARSAHYRCGLILWNDQVVVHLPTGTSQRKVEARLRAAVASGGTSLAPAVSAATTELGPLTGDRVVCVFGDGGIGDPGPAEEAAARARGMGIRFVVRGLGPHASDSLASALDADGPRADRTIEDVGGVRRGIASMVESLRARR